MSADGRCRHCGAPLEQSFCDLGLSPLANSYVEPEQLNRGETFLPLHVLVCNQCWLVQLQEFESPANIFSDYAYFSSYSQSWLEHARVYSEEMTARFGFDSTSSVIEIASNDGYLLQNFAKKGIRVLGIEPAANVALVAEQQGIPSLVKFFGSETAQALVQQGQQADLLIGNNVLAHVPQLNDFVQGMKILLKPTGLITMEFPYLVRLMAENQFDTIYHEHFSYFSFVTVERIFRAHGLQIFDVQQLTTHGGSLRIFASHVGAPAHPIKPVVPTLLAEERAAGLEGAEAYRNFSRRVQKTKRGILKFLIEANEQGKKVVGYGAPAKGNTLLNYCGVRSDLIEYTVDRSPHKQNRFLPGCRIPILSPDAIRETKPDYVLILPWNLEREITEQMAYVREWGGRFVVPIPEIKIID